MTSIPQSAVTSVVVAPTRMSSPRRSRRPRPERRETMASDATTRTENFPYGIASVGLGEVERRVPVEEPSPLAPNALLSVIGKPVPRQNGRAKVTGATRFTVDISLPGMLQGLHPAFAPATCEGSRHRH